MFKLKTLLVEPETIFKLTDASALGAGQRWMIDVQGSVSSGLYYTLFYLILLPCLYKISPWATTTEYLMAMEPDSQYFGILC